MRYIHSIIKLVIRNSHFDLYYLYSSTIVPDEWNDKGVYLKILKIFDEHFETVKFVIDNNNSRVTIMKTREGFIKPEKEEYHDEILDKEMREVE